MKTIATTIAALAMLTIAAPAHADDTTPEACVTADAWAASQSTGPTMGQVHRLYGTPGVQTWTSASRWGGRVQAKDQAHNYPACDGGTYTVDYHKDLTPSSDYRWHATTWTYRPDARTA